MTKKLEILKKSLAKKQKMFNDKIDAHFKDVKSANGQPLNDKKNGYKTIQKWEKQNIALKNLQASIDKTKKAIEKEEKLINNIKNSNIPEALLKRVETGEITQWRKYPNYFFIKGVEKARLIWNEKKKKLFCKYLNQIKNKEQFEYFKKIAIEIDNEIKSS